MRITLSGEVLVIGGELLVDVEAVDVYRTIHGRRVNGNPPKLGKIPILWQLVKSIAVNIYTHC